MPAVLQNTPTKPSKITPKSIKKTPQIHPKSLPGPPGAPLSEKAFPGPPFFVILASFWAPFWSPWDPLGRPFSHLGPSDVDFGVLFASSFTNLDFTSVFDRFFVHFWVPSNPHNRAETKARASFSLFQLTLEKSLK